METGEAIRSLSEKERQALRLLLAGHDAKSSARVLGVSHHAIHDRLRRARQKLGTTGSREAALILDALESPAPDPVVHKPIGDEPPPPFADDSSSAQTKRPVPFWSQWRGKGLILMSVTTLVIAAALTLNSPGGAVQKTASADQGPADAVQGSVDPAPQARSQSIGAARDFLTLVDAGDAAASYEAAAPAFRNAHGFGLWELAVAFHAKDGGARRRTLASVEADSAPTNPDYAALEILVFDTIMMNGDHKSERLAMALIDGVWRLVTIDIYDVG